MLRDEKSKISQIIFYGPVTGREASITRSKIGKIEKFTQDAFERAYNGQPNDFLVSDEFNKLFDTIDTKIRSRRNNLYWIAVENDLAESIRADNIIKVNANNQMLSALTGEEIKNYEKYMAIIELVHTSKKYIQELINILGKDETDISASESFYEKLPFKIGEWIGSKYMDITNETNIEKIFMPGNNVRQKLLNQVLGWLKESLKAEIYINLGQVYASPTTKELTHVKRGVTEKGKTGFYFGELFLRKLATMGSLEESNKGQMFEYLVVLMIDEAMHIGKKDISHGKIETIEDIDKKVDHILSMNISQFPMKVAEKAWEESIENKPWEANLPGANVGKDSEMIDFFERLEQFAEKDGKGTALIYGPEGSGKNMAVEAVCEMMGVKKKDVAVIDCALLTKLDKKTQLQFIDELRRQNAELVIIDNLNYADNSLEKILKSVIDLLDAKVLCLGAGRNCVSPRGDLHTRIEMFFEMPPMAKRGDDIVRLAEHFNKQASKEYHTAYAPIDRYFGENIRKVVEAGGEIINPVSLWDLRKLIYNIVANRAILLKKKELPENSPDTNAWRDSCGKNFSSLIITFADVYYLGSFIENTIPKFKSLIGSSYIAINEKYDEQQTIMPYFKQLAPKDAQGNPIGFYKGIRGEQPGLPEKKEKEEPIKWDKIEEGSNVWGKLLGKEEAQKVGIQIAPPVSNYTLFVSYDIATQEDFDKDKNEIYASRFGLEKIQTDRPEKIIDNVLQMSSLNNLDPAKVMVQLPEEFSKPEYEKEIARLSSSAPGIRFMIIDTKGLKNDTKTTPQEKAQYRTIIYSMMLLARHANKGKPNADLDSLLEYFLDFCFKSETIKKDEYIDALKRDDLMIIAKTALSYQNMRANDLPVKALVSATLISA